MTISEIAALVAVLLSVGTNVALYVHLSSRMETRFARIEDKFARIEDKFARIEDKIDARFDSVDRRLEMILGHTHDMDVRITKLEN